MERRKNRNEAETCGGRDVRNEEHKAGDRGDEVCSHILVIWHQPLPLAKPPFPKSKTPE